MFHAMRDFYPLILTKLFQNPELCLSWCFPLGWRRLRRGHHFSHAGRAQGRVRQKNSCAQRAHFTIKVLFQTFYLQFWRLYSFYIMLSMPFWTILSVNWPNFGNMFFLARVQGFLYGYVPGGTSRSSPPPRASSRETSREHLVPYILPKCFVNNFSFPLAV